MKNFLTLYVINIEGILGSSMFLKFGVSSELLLDCIKNLDSWPLTKGFQFGKAGGFSGCILLKAPLLFLIFR